MAITPNPVTNFSGALYQFLYQVEGDVPFVYNDSKGIPTLGVGYALVTGGNPPPNTWQVRNGYQTVLANAGISLTATQTTTLNDDLSDAAKALNNEIDPLTNKPYVNPFSPALSNTNILDWTITTPQAESLFNTIISGYETQVQTWLGNNTLYASLQGSQEMLVLVSLAYNGILKNSPTLKADILAGNRADAWFQIRYGSNGGQSAGPGIAKRRYYESQVFGIFDTPNQPTTLEAEQAYQMLTNHRDTILAYEKQYGTDPNGASPETPAQQIAAANNNYSLTGNNVVQTLTQTFDTAETVLINSLQSQYSGDTEILSSLLAANFLSTNIYVAGDTAPQSVAAANNAASLLMAGAGNDTLIGGVGNTILIGGSSADTLKSGSGNDTLIGGTGNDSMIGGSGSDTFVYIKPTGVQVAVDTIDDSLGNGAGSVYVGNTQLTGGTAVAGKDNTWTDGNGDQYAWNTSTGALTISQGLLGANSGDQIVIDNFNLNAAETNPHGYLGIKFGEQLAAAASASTADDPFSNGGTYTPATQAATVADGNVQTVTLYASTVSDTDQTVTVTGGSASAFISTGANLLAFNGTLNLIIPAGQDHVTFGLVDTSNSSTADTLNLSASLTNADGTVSSNALAVTFDSPAVASTSVTPDYVINGDMTPVNFGTAASPQYHVDFLGDIVTSGSSPDFNDTLFGIAAGNDSIETRSGNSTLICDLDNDTVNAGGFLFSEATNDLHYAAGRIAA